MESILLLALLLTLPAIVLVIIPTIIMRVFKIDNLKQLFVRGLISGVVPLIVLWLTRECTGRGARLNCEVNPMAIIITVIFWLWSFVVATMMWIKRNDSVNEKRFTYIFTVSLAMVVSVVIMITLVLDGQIEIFRL